MAPALFFSMASGLMIERVRSSAISARLLGEDTHPRNLLDSNGRPGHRPRYDLANRCSDVARVDELSHELGRARRFDRKQEAARRLCIGEERSQWRRDAARKVDG